MDTNALAYALLNIDNRRIYVELMLSSPAHALELWDERNVYTM
jgi:two-component sensor histidine kinase